MCVRVSQSVVDLVARVKAPNGSEKANFVNSTEQQQILDAVRQMQQSGMSEEQIDANLRYIQSELEITNVSVNYEIKGENRIGQTGPTTFKFEIKPKETYDIRASCTDYEERAKNDADRGEDPQYHVLSKNKRNFLVVDQETGNIRGYYDADNSNGTTVKKDKNGVIISVSGNVAPLPEGMPTNIRDVIKQDFSRYGTNLVEMFPNNEEGAKKLLEALSRIPGNEENQNLTLENVRELLSYIHTGANTQGKSNVQELQRLLTGMTGSTGVDISDKNNPKGGDNAYGYATTLQVRSLGAYISKNCGASVEITADDEPPTVKPKEEPKPDPKPKQEVQRQKQQTITPSYVRPAKSGVVVKIPASIRFGRVGPIKPVRLFDICPIPGITYGKQPKGSKVLGAFKALFEAVGKTTIESKTVRIGGGRHIKQVNNTNKEIYEHSKKQYEGQNVQVVPPPKYR